MARLQFGFETVNAPIIAWGSVAVLACMHSCAVWTDIVNLLATRRRVSHSLTLVAPLRFVYQLPDLESLAFEEDPLFDEEAGFQPPLDPNDGVCETLSFVPELRSLQPSTLCYTVRGQTVVLLNPRGRPFQLISKRDRQKTRHHLEQLVLDLGRPSEISLKRLTHSF